MPADGDLGSMDTCEDEAPLTDPFCDPNHPVVVSFQDVSAAAYKIKKGVDKTPCSVRTILTSFEIMNIVFSSMCFSVNKQS